MNLCLMSTRFVSKKSTDDGFTQSKLRILQSNGKYISSHGPQGTRNYR